MWRQLAVLIVLNLQLRESLQASSLNGKYYMAAVVEFAQTSVGTADNDTIEENTNRYVKFIHTAGELGADIIVFPEMGLTGLFIPRDEDGSPKIAFEVPDPATNFNPCANESESVSQTLVALSCAAANASVYTVINLPEVVPCPAEAACKGTFYNTNIVFDRRGNVIARYRKFNLYGELGFSAPKDPDYSMFDTDFGVTFGMITCFDIMFYEPAIHLVQSYFIKDVIMPTAWFSEMPFLTAIQYQAAWSRALDVNLLTAGFNWPWIGNSGSGIHAGKLGTIAATFVKENTTAMLVGPVPRRTCDDFPPLPEIQQKAFAVLESDLPDNQSLKFEDFEDRSGSIPNLSCKGNLTSLPEIPQYAGSIPVIDDGEYEGLRLKTEILTEAKTTTIDASFTFQQSSWNICHNSLCCEFNMSLSQMVTPTYKYRVIVFSGKRSHAGYVETAMQICAIISCANDTLESCGSVPYSDGVTHPFNAVTISGTFHDEGALWVPNTLGSNLLPLSQDDFDFRVNASSSSEVDITMRTLRNNVKFYTFGIYSRDFSKDAASTSNSNMALLFALSVFTLLLSRVLII